MKKYKNLGGDSGVIGYRIAPDFIEVKFSDSSLYHYSYQSTGVNRVERMKELAEAGEGLNAYINTEVKKDFEWSSR